MDAAELSRWTRFAAKGGIGKCTAIQDCIAESSEDLMFLKDDEITVLMQVPGDGGQYLGYCEGVVGRFHGAHVHFHAKLKRPVMTKRASSTASTSPSLRSASMISSPGRDADYEAMRSLVNSPVLSAPSSALLTISSSESGQQRPVAPAERPPRQVAQLPLTASPFSEDRDVPADTTRETTALRHQDSRHAGTGDSNGDLAPDALVKTVTEPPLTASPLQVDGGVLEDQASPTSTSPRQSIQQPPSITSDVAPTDWPKQPTETPAGPEQPLVEHTPPSPPLSYSEPTFTTDDSGPSMSRVTDALADREFDIGLTMLQGMDDMDSSDEDSDDDNFVLRPREVHTPEPRPEPVPQESVHASPASTIGVHGQGSTPTRAPATNDTSRPASSIHPSGSDIGEDSEWDGASDIYDDYRYSRFSMASKMSRFSIMSRAQRNDQAPPVPFDGVARPSFDRITVHTSSSRQSVDSRGSDPTSPASPAVSAFGEASKLTKLMDAEETISYPRVTPLAIIKNPSPSGTPTQGETPGTGRRIPPPLNLRTSSHQTALLSSTSRTRPTGLDVGTSPLLHTNFSSTSSQPSINSPLLSTSISISSGRMGSGAASALRQRLEIERGPSPSTSAEMRPTPSAEDSSPPRTGGIVIEDDENTLTTPFPQMEQSATASASPSHLSPSPSSIATESQSPSSVTSIPVGMSSSTSNPTPSPSEPLSEKQGPRDSASHFVPAPPYSPMASTATAVDGQSLPVDVKTAPQAAAPSQQTAALQQTQAHRKASFGAQQSTPFLPHPNAPKPNPTAPGQRLVTVGRPPSHPPRTAQAPASSSLIATMQMAAAARAGPGGAIRPTTLYGRTVRDLVNSAGPVPIVWSLEPMASVSETLFGAQGRVGSPLARPPQRSATAHAAIAFPNANPRPSAEGEQKTSPAPAEAGPQAERAESPASNVIPRANFFPQVGAARPRSRSFSGFTTPFAEVPVPVHRSNSEEGDHSFTIPTVQAAVRASLLGSSTETVPQPQPQRQSSLSAPAPPSTGSTSRTSHAPSPLSLPQNNTVVTPRSPNFKTPPPPSPLSRPPLSPLLPQPQEDSTHSRVEPNQPKQSPSKPSVLRQVASSITLRSNGSSFSISSPAAAGPSVMHRRNSGPTDPSPLAVAPSLPPAPGARVMRTSASSHQLHQRTTSQQSRHSASGLRRGSLDTVESSQSDARSTMTSPPPLGGGSVSSASSSPPQRKTSLKVKLSLSALRSKSRDRDEPSTPLSTAPATPTIDSVYAAETVQVKDTDFELVRPTIRRMSSERQSEDSGRPSTHLDARPDSPAAASFVSTQNSRAHSETPATRPAAKTGDGRSSMDAHRARELKWIAAMASTPEAQARRSKKVRKLLMEGVPSSVRYLVWAHLADSKARRISGVYSQLGKRTRVAASDEIERDVRVCFPDHPHLQSAKGPLVMLLQAYLTMVPDLEYQTSLTIIAGHLLLQSPEEDAFWTFLSIMDTHLRSYFSPKTVQMEVDASLFSKAVEATDPQLAKRVFLDLDMSALAICKPWFSSIFADSLPSEYVNRVWDVFLYDGPPFLFRVGLALLSYLRSSLLAPNASRDTLLALLSHPPAHLLPPDAETLLSLAMSVKLKDEEVRRQRIKLEAQLKRQTQSTAPSRAGSTIFGAISLPRS